MDELATARCDGFCSRRPVGDVRASHSEATITEIGDGRETFCCSHAPCSRRPVGDVDASCWSRDALVALDFRPGAGRLQRLCCTTSDQLPVEMVFQSVTFLIP